MIEPVDREETAGRLMIRAIRGWHFQPEQWRLNAEADAQALAGAEATAALNDLDAVMGVLAQSATRDIMLRPLPCRKQSPDERALLDAFECAGAGDEVGCRSALSALLAGSALTEVAGLLSRLTARFALTEPAPRFTEQPHPVWAAALGASATLH